jgi:hypothetical protein
LRPKSEDASERFVFVLLDNFTLLSFASALDALRIANRMLGYHAYQWMFIGEGGETARCSAGTTFALDDDLCELHRDDVMMLCGGVNIQMATTKKVLNWLRREARRGPDNWRVVHCGLPYGQSRAARWETGNNSLGEPGQLCRRISGSGSNKIRVHYGWESSNDCGRHIFGRPDAKDDR